MPASIKMKQLEAQTGFSREAIRFYIRNGILPEPEKPKANVAFYSQVHIKRLLAIKYMQQERQMSLAKIKIILAGGEFDAIAKPSSLKGLEQLLPTLLDGTAPAENKSIAQLVAETGLSAAEIDDLAARGVLDFNRESSEQGLGYRDVIILKKWAQAREAGFSDERGYNHELLELYEKTAEQLAEYEIELFFSGFSGDASSSEAARAAATGIECANAIIQQLHTKAVLKAIERRLK